MHNDQHHPKQILKIELQARSCLSTQSDSIEKYVRCLTDRGWRGKEKGPPDNFLLFVLLDLASSFISVFVVAAKDRNKFMKIKIHRLERKAKKSTKAYEKVVSQDFNHLRNR